jgi:DnaJ-class molecular chaperone
MNADHHRDEPCPRCLGSGSGIYNALSPKSTCEVCEGTGLRVDRWNLALLLAQAAIGAVAQGARP